MQTEKIREYLRAAPFKPFRVFLSDGSFHIVPHPEFAWLTARTLFIGSDPNKKGVPTNNVMCDLIHVTKIEEEPEPGPY